MNRFKPFERHARICVTIVIIISALLGAAGSKRVSGVMSYSCVGCADCSKICPLKAIAMIDCKAVINPEKCIGCGQFVFVCSFSAIRSEERKQ